MYVECDLPDGRVVVELSDYLWATPGGDPSDGVEVGTLGPDEDAFWAILSGNF
jgi:hypothetical protein